MNNQKAFTLIEVLIVIGILAILASIVALALNPASQFNRANDTTRRSDVNNIMSAIYQYAVDNQGDLSSFDPNGQLGAVEKEICNIEDPTLVGEELDCVGMVVFKELIDGSYISTIPVDPSCGDCASCDDDEGTGYWATLAATGVITIEAKCAAIGTIEISQ